MQDFFCFLGVINERLLVRHTDAVREWTYDRNSFIAHLDEAQTKGWTVVDMSRDWKVIYPFEQKE